ncbi:patatin-like phospholipase family protein [PVC group bacterium]|nr:patatin-like phospholipase family protein [PVC group bacterium]
MSNPNYHTLKHCPLFHSLSDREINSISNKSSLVFYSRGEVVQHINEVGQYLYIVKSGQIVVKVPKTDDNKERILTILNASDYFGEMSLLTGDKTSAETTASLDTEMLLLTKKDFNDFISKSHVISLNLSHILSQRLKKTNIQQDLIYTPSIISILTADPKINTSPFALNLALSLRAETHKNVLFIDFNSQFHINSSSCETSKKPDLHEFFKTINNPECREECIQEHVHKFMDFQDMLVFSQDEKKFLQEMDPKHIAPFLGGLHKKYDLLLISSGIPKSEFSFKSIDQSHKTIILTTTQKDSLRHLYRLLYELREKTIDINLKSKLALFYNVFMPRSLLGQIRNASKINSTILIPTRENEPLFETKKIIPIVIDEPASKTTRQMNTLARELGGAKIGLALGSGGARAMAHIGILKVFEKEGIPVDMISGTSMGAVIGAMYATGVTAAEIENRLFHDLGKGRSSILDYSLWPRTSITKGGKIKKLLQDFFGHMTFDQLPIPVYVLCTDLITSSEIVLEKGILYRALLASSSIPVLMPPVRWKNHYLIDGAVSNSVPADILKSKGAHIIITSTVTPYHERFLTHSPYSDSARQSKPKGLLSVFDRFFTEPTMIRIITRTVGVSSLNNARFKTRDADIRIEPEIEQFSFFDFHRFRDLVKTGEEAAYKVVDEIKKITIKKLLATQEKS